MFFYPSLMSCVHKSFYFSILPILADGLSICMFHNIKAYTHVLYVCSTTEKLEWNEFLRGKLHNHSALTVYASPGFGILRLPVEDIAQKTTWVCLQSRHKTAWARLVKKVQVGRLGGWKSERLAVLEKSRNVLNVISTLQGNGAPTVICSLMFSRQVGPRER